MPKKTNETVSNSKSDCCNSDILMVVDPGENNDDPIREIYCSKCKKVCDILEYPEVKFDKPCKSWSAK